jgi:alcohol dehydrogenase class IV
VGFAAHLEPDVIISLGGGSVTDTAKSLRLALWLGIREREDFDRAFRSNKNNWQDLSPELLATPLLPQVGMPTTLISAEPTQGMGITDDQGQGKQVFSHPDLKSVAIFLDPSLSIRTPEQLWLSSGVKAMEHAIAKLSALERNPVLDPIAAQAVAILSRDLIKSKANRDDLTARGNLLIASWLCMFGSWRSLVTRMGLSHALGRQVGGVSGAPHGLISAVLLPRCMEFNAPAGGSGLLLEAQALGLDLPGLTPEKAAIQSAAKVRQIVQALELPSRLRDIGVDQDDLPKIAEKTMGDMSAATNPREIRDAEQVLELLQEAW